VSVPDIVPLLIHAILIVGALFLLLVVAAIPGVWPRNYAITVLFTSCEPGARSAA